MVAPIYQITIRSGPTPGKTFPIEADEVNFGRDLANDITISDPEISRRHARFFVRDDNIFLEDLGSTNGTFLNGERISTPQQLRAGDVITFGEHIVVVFERVTYEMESTVVAHEVPVFEEDFTPEPRSYQTVQEPEAYAQPLPEPQKVSPLPSMKPARVAETAKPPKEKKGGLPSWMVVLIIGIAVLVFLIAITLYFMPASWWCAITLNSLAGCPVP